MEEFDESKAVKLINEALEKEFGIVYDDDEILNVIDIIWDWYDDNGFTDVDLDGDADDDVDVVRLTAHVVKMLARDSDSPVSPEHVPAIVKAEMDYENSISIL